MDENKKKLLTYGVISVLTFLSFLLSYASFMASRDAPGNVTSQRDSLSGEEYKTEDVYNYREANLYGSYLLGFNSLTDAGVTNDDILYLHDVLINFAMYERDVFNGKISYVKDSYKNTDSNRGDLYNSYSFKFGLNNGDIHVIKVRSSWVEEKITISILNTAGKQVFSRDFDISPAPYSA